MANQNLSQFGEKLFVADADHTFIWDTAASISKRVSRNSWLNSGTLTSDAPVTISQTWGTTGIYTAAKVNVTETATANSTSKLLDLQVGTVSKFSVNKGGFITAAGVFVNVVGKAISNPAGQELGFGYTNNGCAFYRYSTTIASFVNSASVGGNSSGLNLGTDALGFASSAEGALSVVLLRDGADNTLALRNGAAAQTFNVYGTWTTAITNFERLAIKYNTTDLAYQIAAEKGTTNGDYRPLQLWTGGASRLHVTTAGNVGIGTTAPTAPLDVKALAGTGVREVVFKTSVSDSGDDSLVFHNGTSSANVFSPVLVGGCFSDAARGCLGVAGQTLPVSDSGTTPVVYFQARTIGNSSDPTGAAVYGSFVNRPLFQWLNGTSAQMQMAANGNLGIGTTSPTSKLHVVGDAVLTGDLLGTNYTIGVPTILTQSNISITNNHSGVADSAIVITPKGTGGVIFGSKPDGTTTGGNARGIYSVDLQTAAKTGPAQVASGAYSALVGGQANRASGAHSFCGGGNSNTPSGTFSVTCGGQSNIASGGQSFIGGGVGNTASSTNAFIAGGIQGLADRFSISAHSSGQFATTGDAQTTKAVFRNKTTTNSAVELFLDGASTRYAVTSGKIISMLINITGTKSDGSAVAHYVRQYSIKNIGGTTSQVYAAVTVGTDTAAGTSIAISADDTNDSLKIEVTGVAAETWRWVASVDAVEVGHGV